MRGDPGSLFDAHATRLYAYCWSLVGESAPAAVRDTFVAAMQHPPRGDAVLWLYALARPACMELGALDNAFGRSLHAPGGSLHAPGDPLMRAAAALRADHREVLLLAAGEWLDVPDIARVLGIAPDTVLQLLHTARTRLERSVLETLMRDPGSPYDPEVIGAFEKGALPRLLAHRAPHQVPPQLKPDVLAACAAEIERPMSTMAASSPLVVIGDGARARESRRRRAKGITAVAGVAASVAAAVGLVASWTSAKSGGGDDVRALSPGSGQAPGTSTSGDTPVTGPGRTGSDPVTSTGSGPSTSSTGPYEPAPGTVPPGTRTSPPPGPGPGTTPPPGDGPSTPKTPGPKTPAPPTPPPPSPGPSSPTPPTTPPTQTPTDPGTPPPRPTDPPEQSPSPSTNPSPTPSDSP